MSELTIDPQEERTIVLTALQADKLLSVLHKALQVATFDQAKFITMMYDKLMDTYRPTASLVQRV